MPTNPKRLRHALVTGAIMTGASLGAAGLASAATSSSTPSSSSSPSAGSSSTATPPVGSPSTPSANGSAPDPATLTHGPNETLLTGTDLQKATAAATAAVPGATIIRAETDSSGASPYEVHMKKADGSYVTVQLDSSFNVVKTISGFGAGPAGGHATSGTMPPAAPSA